MGTDYFCRMGSQHQICQDYCLAGEKNGVEFAVVSDGCSGSPVAGEPGSPFTDWGARFLVKAAVKHFEDREDDEYLSWALLDSALKMTHAARLGDMALDATLVAAVCREGVVKVIQYGDGVVAARGRDGSISYSTVEFDNNMPHYLSYILDERRHARYLKESPRRTWKFGDRGADGTWKLHYEETESNEKLCSDASLHFAEDTDLVLVMSDGVLSFTDDRGQPVELTRVLDELFALKNLNGAFLTRRCTAFLTCFCAKHGWRHADDFSIAGIYLGAEP